MGHFGKKNLVKSFEKPCVHSRGHIFSLIIMKVGQNVCLHEISDKNLKMDHVGSKIRSLGQTLEKHCVCSRDQIFGLILMKLVQSFYLDESLYIF